MSIINNGETQMSINGIECAFIARMGTEPDASRGRLSVPASAIRTTSSSG